MSESDRSPIKDKPLRGPGQSLEERRRFLLESKFETWAFISAFLVALAVFEWFRHIRPTPPQPWLLTTCAVGMLGFTAWRYWRIRPQMRQLRQGMEGQKVVGQFLERLRSGGLCGLS